MSRFQKIILQLTLYGAVLIYITADLLLFHGPIAQKIEAKNPFSAENIAAAKANGVVARVYEHPITRGQVDRAISERLWLTGKNFDSLSPQERKLTRYAALDTLIDHELLRVKAMMNAREASVDNAELIARIERFKQRFPNEKERLQAMKSQGIRNDDDLRDRLAAQIQQENYVALKIDPLCKVSEEEALDWFEQHKQSLGQPERVRARHIFMASLETDDATAKRDLQAAKQALADGRSQFEQLAKSISQDDATRQSGGDLGWMTRQRLPAALAKAAFTNPLHQPTIVQSDIGWHLLEVTDRKGTAARSYEDAREEVIAALSAVKRREAVAKFRQALRQFEHQYITVFHDMME